MHDVLVVGAGLVGTWAAGELARGGARVLAVDRWPTAGYFARFSALPDDLLVELDEPWTASLQGLVRARRWRAVINATGETGSESGTSGGSSAAELLASWLAGTGSRLVHISSLAVYGTGSGSLTEDLPPSPRTDYGRGKLAEERAVQVRSSLDYCILRPCGLFGPLKQGRGSHSARFLDLALRRAIAHGSVQLRGDPSWSDEYLYVRELARAVTLAATVDLGSERVINVGRGLLTSIEDVAAAIKLAVPGVTVDVVGEPSNRPALPPLCTERARRVLGFEPRYRLEDALSECASFMWSGA